MNAVHVRRKAYRSPSIRMNRTGQSSVRRGRRPAGISVPRPAMLVATVTAPNAPASWTIRASSPFLTASSLLWATCASERSRLISSDCSTVRVPTSTGRPMRFQYATSSTIASSFSLRVAWTRGGWSTRREGLAGSTRATSRPYDLRNVSRASNAVPVIPDTWSYCRTSPSTVRYASARGSGRTRTPSFCLESGLQAVLILTVRLATPREVVDQYDPSVRHDVVLVTRSAAGRRLKHLVYLVCDAVLPRNPPGERPLAFAVSVPPAARTGWTSISGKLGMEVGGVEDWAESAFYEGAPPA